MKNEKLTEIFLYVCFIGRLIRQFFVCPDWVLDMQEQEANILAESFDTRAEKRSNRKRIRLIRLRRQITQAQVTKRALKKRNNELVIILKVDKFKDLIRCTYRFDWLYLRMKRTKAAKTHSFFKRWTDAMNYHLTLLFGLINTSSGNIYEALFGASFVRIH